MRSSTFKACLLSLLLVFIISGEKVLGITANPRPVVYNQPDGTTITLRLHGDEFIHWAETKDGYTIMSDKDGAYVYAITDQQGKLGFSQVIAHDPENRNPEELSFLGTIGKKLFFSASQISEMRQLLKNSKAPSAPLTGGFPHTGTRARLTILANFSNTSTTYTQANFDNMMNLSGYNGTGSFKDFYLEVSYGQLIVNTTVTTWVTLPNTHDFYGPDTEWGQFALDAVTAANNQTAINFAQFDNDGDGYVDGVCIIHQGRGQEESGSTLDIWSHSWELSSAGFSTAQCTFDGVIVDAYTAQPEKGSSSTISTVGVMCHEFGHNLGSPDFYDTDYSTNGSYEGTGDWDLMAGGSWNGNSGDKPAHPNPYVKAYVYGWATPVILSSAQSVLLRNAETYTDFVRYNTTTSNEYFLCENRQLSGFDAGLPGHGMIIYHVDGSYIASHSNANDINAGSHQGLYPVCANATGNPPTSYGTISSGGCSFPGTGNKTTFTDATTPNSKSWAGANTGYPLITIAESGGQISFCFVSCSSPDDPTSFTATPVSSSQINLSWGHNASNSNVLVAYSTSSTFGTPAAGTTYAAGNAIPGGGTVLYNGAGLSFNHTGLTQSTTYYYKAWSVLSGTTYSTGVTTNATTLCNSFTPPFTEAFSGTTIPNCWTQADNQGSGQVWQFGTITGQSPNPTLTGNYAYLNSDAYGSGNSQNADLISPTIDLTGYTNVTLAFSHYFKSYSGSSGTVSYSINNGSTWTSIQSFTTTSATNPASFSQVIAAVAGQSQVKFKWNYTGTYGYYWAFDNVSVTGTPSLSLSVTPSNQNVTPPAGTTTFTVTTTGSWSAVSNQTWCTIAPSSGTGNGTITATYAQNGTASQRIATITTTVATVTPVAVTVTQAAPTLSVSPANQAALPAAGSTTFAVTSNSNWTASSNQSWCTVTSSGTGSGIITANYTQNSTAASRVATITVTVSGLTPITVTVTQSAPTLSVTPSNQPVTYPAGSTSFTLTSNTSWTASSDQAWCTVTGSGTGDGSIAAGYTQNTNLTSRVATITVTVTGLSPVQVTVTQAAFIPTLGVTPSNQSVTAAAGSTAYTVTSNSSWTATSDQAWCTVTASGSGNGSITANYSENTSYVTRVANITVTVTGLTPVVVTVTQAGATPPAFLYTIANDVQTSEKTFEFDLLLLDNDASSSFELATIQAGILLNPAIYNGGTVSVQILPGTSTLNSIQQPTNVSVTQSANVIKLAAKAPPGSGNGTIISTNASSPTRICRLKVTNTVDWATAQPNLAFCFTTTPYPTKISQYIAGTNTALVTNLTNCYSVCTNNVLNPPAALSVTPPDQTVTAAAGSTSFTVTSNRTWTAVSDQSWCTVTSGGYANGTISATYSANSTSGSRVANITVSVTGLTPVVVTVSQNGLANKTLNLSLLLEGLYDGAGMMHPAMDESSPHWGAAIADKITVELHASGSYSSLLYSISNVDLLTNGTAAVTLPSTYNGSYYITIRHRNSIETVSATAVSFAGSTITYSFDSGTKAFGGNMKQAGDGWWLIYSGDPNQDGLVDSSDMIIVDNDAAAFSVGYRSSDLSGDGLVDSDDMIILDNNAAVFIATMLP